MLNARLQSAVAAAAGILPPAKLQLMQCSSTGATGAIIVHAWLTGTDHARAVIKTPRNVRLPHSLHREWQAVNQLRADHAELAVIVPAALATFELDGAECFVYDGARGRTMYARFRNRIVRSRRSMLQRFAAQALPVACTVHRSDTRQVAGDRIAGDLLHDLAWLERTVSGWPEAVSACGRAIARRLETSHRPLPYGRIHGDFSPYNLLTDSLGKAAEVRLIDWEHTEPDRPQHLDVFRFMAACALMGLRGEARQSALSDMATRDPSLRSCLLQPWLARLGAPNDVEAWLEPEALEALWWHFWVHAARREQERRAAPGDFQGATYVPGLVALAASSPALARLGANGAAFSV